MKRFFYGAVPTFALAFVASFFHEHAWLVSGCVAFANVLGYAEGLWRNR